MLLIFKECEFFENRLQVGILQQIWYVPTTFGSKCFFPARTTKAHIKYHAFYYKQNNKWYMCVCVCVCECVCESVCVRVCMCARACAFVRCAF